MLARLLPRTTTRTATAVVRPFSTSLRPRADTKAGGFGEAAREEKGSEPVKDTAPYQNEYTKSGTNSEVAHNADSYDGANTDPEQSNRTQGAALDGSPANKAYSEDASLGTSNKTRRDTGHASSYTNTSSGETTAPGAESSRTAQGGKDKFAKMGLDNGHDDGQTVGGRKVTN